MNDDFDFFADVDDILFPCKPMKYDWSIEWAIGDAEKRGCTVTRSTSTSILLDIDNGASMDRYFAVFPKIKNKFDLKFKETWKSTNNNDHIILTCRELSFPCRVAIAACLGSDPIREALAIAMFNDELVEPSVLFKPGKPVTYLDEPHTKEPEEF